MFINKKFILAQAKIGFSNAQLADYLDCDVDTIKKYRKGVSAVPVEKEKTLNKLLALVNQRY